MTDQQIDAESDRQWSEAMERGTVRGRLSYLERLKRDHAAATVAQRVALEKLLCAYTDEDFAAAAIVFNAAGEKAEATLAQWDAALTAGGWAS